MPDRDAKPAALPYEQVEMVDGRVYYSTDGWHTVFLLKEPGAPPRRVTGRAADLARFLAIQSH